MFDPKSLDQLGPIADEMLGGLQADEAMRLKIMRAAKEQKHAKKNTMKRYAPAVCMAALAIACVGVIGTRMGGDEAAIATLAASAPATVSVETIAAGEGTAFDGGEMIADLGDHAKVRASAPSGKSLFEAGQSDIPLVTVNGAIYQMLSTPKDIGSSMLGAQVGAVTLYDEHPSMASPKEMAAGLSNVAEAGSAVYAVKGVADSTLVACQAEGSMRVFQRVSYAGKGPAGASLEDTFSVRGKVKTAELSGVGTLEGDKANAAIAVLLDEAVLKSADATARKQTLTVTLESGLKLQLGVSGDTLCGCGGWSCPEFFEAFEAAL